MDFSRQHLKNALFVLVVSILVTGLAHGVTLEAFPKTLNRSGDNVTLQWKGIPSPSDMDWLGIYSPADSADDNFIGYIFLSSCPTWKEGSGSVELPLINLRSPYEFRVFHWDKSQITNTTPVDSDHNPLPSTAHLLAKSESVTFRNLNDPAQLHLAFTSNEDEMRVMFVTKEEIKSYVRYGSDEGELDEVAEAESLTYKQSEMCDAPANTTLGWRDPGYIHDAVMQGLKPGKRYFYQVGSDQGGWSSVQSFVSRDKDSDETIAFLFGDMGTSVPYRTFLWTQEESKLTVKWLKRDIEELGDKPSFISHIGDISYARGYAWLWDSFFTQIEPLASKVPFHVCIGNHEYDWPLQPWKPEWAATVYGTDGGGECGVPYSLKFHMPGNSSFLTGTSAPSTKNLYYSFDLGVVHFLYISTETNFLRGSDQYAYIEQDLKNVDRSKTPFVVVQGHRPMYTTNYELRDAPLREKMIEHLEPLLVEYKVNLVLWGHVHKYERFCPLRNLSCGTTGMGADFPVHVVIGMAGQDYQPKWEPRPDHPTDPIYPQPARSFYRSSEFGYTRLHATREALTLSYIGNHDGQVHDLLEIHQKIGGKASWSWIRFFKASSLFLVGTLFGFIVGYLLYSRKEKVKWTGLKTYEF
uniref:Purple acid phosphatase n=1 Tax=Wollemia nobilis TaxID=56998 RepID=A0A0C9QQA8_9CONI